MNRQKRTVSVFGATGTVGMCTADVLAAHPNLFEVDIVTARGRAKELAVLAKKLKAKKAVIADSSSYTLLSEALEGSGIEAAAGEDALLEAAACKVDWTMMAIVGMAGLKPLWEAIRRGGTIAVANKEPLVAAGPFMMRAAAKSGAVLLPVDSEHNAIFQIFEQSNRGAIERLILTASGGPFRRAAPAEIRRATPAQALAHPNWEMGPKITIDSATMMNKALEVIEAHYFFEMPPDKIEVLVHPQSVVHSMVEYSDGSVLAQMGAADMRTPITHALAWPERLDTPGARLDWTRLPGLSFEPVDAERFPALSLAYRALEAGPYACVALNAANEAAVAAFLGEKIALPDIVDLAAQSLESAKKIEFATLEDIFLYDRDVRRAVESYILDLQDLKAANDPLGNDPLQQARN